MNNIIISLIIGLIAAIIDILPMLIKKLDNFFIVSAFSFYLVLGFLIQWVEISSIGWLNGLILGVLMMVPTMALIAKVDRKAIPVIIANNLLLSTGVGFFSGLFLI